MKKEGVKKGGVNREGGMRERANRRGVIRKGISRGLSSRSVVISGRMHRVVLSRRGLTSTCLRLSRV